MPKLKIDEKTFKDLCNVVFERALDDVNSVLRPLRQLSEPEQVSKQSFERYISNHHPLIHYAASIEMLAMVLYKKAVDDIAFQADIIGFLLREIPITSQRASCEYAVASIDNSIGETGIEQVS